MGESMNVHKDSITRHLLGAMLACGISAGTAQAQDAALLAAAKAEQPAVIETLRRLTAMDSGTGQAEGLGQVAAIVEAELKSLGATVERHPAPPSVGPVVVGKLTGKGRGRVMMMAHMDTVYPAGTAQKRPFRVEGNRAIAPGIADAKGGVAVILHSLRLLKARGFDDFASITVLFNPDEEQGSRGSNRLIQALAAENDAILSFEPSSAQYDIVLLGTSGIAGARVDVTGKPAHAGVSPELGVNAIVELSDLVLRTLDLDDPKRGVRFNWTLSNGGEVSNIVPDKAWARADVRYAREEDLERTLATLKERIAKKRLAGASLNLTVATGMPAFNANAEGRRLAGRAKEIYAEAGAQLNLLERTGGGTDAAWAARSGKPVVEALGLPGAGYHSSSEEYVDIEKIAPRLYLAARLVMEITAAKR